MLELKRPIVALDLETTGTNPKYDRVVQIGAVKVYPDGREKEWETFVNPERDIPPEVTKVHGITNEMVTAEGVLPFSAIGPKLELALADCDLCGYNISFDIRFLKSEFARLHRTFQHGKVVDGFKIFQRKEQRNLKAAVKFFLDEDLDGAHTALVDARASLRVVMAQLERYSDLPRTVEGLNYLFFEKVDEGYLDNAKKLKWRNNKVCLNFGKHKDTPLDQVPKEYLKWMMSGDFSGQVKKILDQALQGQYPRKDEPSQEQG